MTHYFSAIGNHSLTGLEIHRKNDATPLLTNMNIAKDNFTKFWVSRYLNGLELLKATYSTHMFPAHMHETYVLGVIIQGVEKFSCNGVMYTAPKGSIIVVNPREVHTGFSAGDEPWSYRCMYPSAELMESVATQLNAGKMGKPLFKEKVLYDKELYSQLLKFHIKLETENSEIRQNEIFFDIISSLIIKHARGNFEFRNNSSEPVAIKKICQFLYENYKEQVSIDDLLEIANLSKFYLIRSFKKNKGITPYQYLINIRIQKARKFLAEGQEIADVANRTGFSDQSHLTRTFKQIVGITPGVYQSKIN